MRPVHSSGENSFHLQKPDRNGSDSSGKRRLRKTRASHRHRHRHGKESRDVFNAQPRRGLPAGKKGGLVLPFAPMANSL